MGYKDALDMAISGSRTYEVWYAKNPNFRADIPKSISKLKQKYSKVCNIQAGGLEEIFRRMQGEPFADSFWERPKFKDRGLFYHNFLRERGLHHTSMSVGDLVYDIDAGTWFVTADCGFKPFAIFKSGKMVQMAVRGVGVEVK